MVENSYVIYSLRSIRIRTKTGGFGTSPKKIIFVETAVELVTPPLEEL